MTCKCIKKGNTKSDCSFDAQMGTCDLAYNTTTCQYDKSIGCTVNDTCWVGRWSNNYTINCKSVYTSVFNNTLYCCHFRPREVDYIEKVFKYDSGGFVDITSTDEGEGIMVMLNLSLA